MAQPNPVPRITAEQWEQHKAQMAQLQVQLTKQLEELARLRAARGKPFPAASSQLAIFFVLASMPEFVVRLQTPQPNSSTWRALSSTACLRPSQAQFTRNWRD